MYSLLNPNQLYLEDYKMQFGGKLRTDNRWVTLSRHMPWDKIEEIYSRNFSPDTGASALPSRLAFGSIYAKESEDWTDRETMQNIMENPYLQYFLGFKEFLEEPPFDPSMMVHFRKRFPMETINEINEHIFLSIAREAASQGPKERAAGNGPEGAPGKGQLPPQIGNPPEEQLSLHEPSQPAADMPHGTPSAFSGASPSAGSAIPDRPAQQDAPPVDGEAAGRAESRAALPPSGHGPWEYKPIFDIDTGFLPLFPPYGILLPGSAPGPYPIPHVLHGAPANQGKLILDATCAPSDIRYPVDMSLLNESRENIEKMIDLLQQLTRKQGRAEKLERIKARQEFLEFIKLKRPGIKKVRAAIKKQLKYLWGNIEKIGALMLGNGINALMEKHLQRIMTICEVYRQQLFMNQNETHQCEDRILNLRQPHVRCIVRGKAGKKHEFGQKIAVSVVGGYTFVEKQSFNAFNEGILLIESVKLYKERFGFYPEAVLADKIYRNKENIDFCKEHGIRLSGPKLGRPKKQEKEENEKQAYKDSGGRNMVESRFGIAKRRYGLDLIMCYLPETALTEAALQVMCMNISLWLRKLFYFFLLLCMKCSSTHNEGSGQACFNNG